MSTHARKLFLVLAISAAMPAFAADETFVQKAAMGGLAEVDAGNLAQQQGGSDAVKQFGAKMVADHGKANDELKQIATGKSMSVPSAPDAAHQAAKAKLQAKSGAAFDQAFKAQMVADHKATIALFEQEAKNGKDADLKAFASKTLPDLQGHLKMAQALK
jgi:putative membrane protein